MSKQPVRQIRPSQTWAQALQTILPPPSAFSSSAQTTPPPQSTLQRLTTFLQNPGHIQGWGIATSPEDCLSAFVYELQFHPTASGAGQIDLLWDAIFTFLASNKPEPPTRRRTTEVSRQTKRKRKSPNELVLDNIYYWSERWLNGGAADIHHPEKDDSDEHGQLGGGLHDLDHQYITTSLALARLYSLNYGYSIFAWSALRDGAGVGGEDVNTDSMRIAACAQILGGGQRIRSWCVGEDAVKTPRDPHSTNSGSSSRSPTPTPTQTTTRTSKANDKPHAHDSDPPTPEYSGFLQTWLNKTAEPSEEIFEDILEGLKREAGNTESEWVRAMVKETLEHVEGGKQDLSSMEVWSIIYEKTKPVGVLVNDCIQ